MARKADLAVPFIYLDYSGNKSKGRLLFLVNTEGLSEVKTTKPSKLGEKPPIKKEKGGCLCKKLKFSFPLRYRLFWVF